jgi:trigger factor
VKSTCEPLEGNKVKLAVEIDETEFDRDIDAAFRKLASEIRLPGFRAGKAPRKVLEARIGIEPARGQALQDSIPKYLMKAVREHAIDLIDTPSIEVVSGADGGVVSFDATCEVRPEVTVPGYGGLRVELPTVEVSAEEIDEAVDGERQRHASLQPVERPAAMNDSVTLDLSASRDGEPIVGLNVEDWEYRIGQGWVAPTFDDELIGASAGDHLHFTATPNGTEDAADFSVQVTAVSELVLPELNDDWVADHLGEFDTVEEWRDSIARRLADNKLAQARNMVVDRTSMALAELVDLDVPESMVRASLQQRIENFARQLQGQGITLDQWFQFTGQDATTFMDDMKERAEVAVKVDLALRAVATAEAIETDDDDLEMELQRIALQFNQKVNQVRKAYERNDALDDLKSEIRKSKALDWLLHRVEMVDTEGRELDRELVLGHNHDHDHDDHDHDHDHQEDEA